MEACAEQLPRARCSITHKRRILAQTRPWAESPAEPDQTRKKPAFQVRCMGQRIICVIAPLNGAFHMARPALQGVEMPASRRIRPQGVTLRSVIEKPLQLLKLVSEVRILADLALDLADRVQNGRVVATAEPPPDLGQ